MWKLALYGTDSFVALTAVGEYSLTSLPPNPATNAEWLKIEILGASPRFAVEVQQFKGNGGFLFEARQQRLELNVKLKPIKFPSEMGIIQELKNLLKKRLIFLYNIDYPVTLHSANFAVAVNVSVEVEDDYENGIKDITLKITKIKAE